MKTNLKMKRKNIEKIDKNQLKFKVIKLKAREN